MTRIKMCGLRRMEDIAAANELKPDYVGFVLFPGSRRYIAPEEARKLRAALHPEIRAVGVFVDEAPETVAGLLADGIVEIAQLHGREDEAWLARLRRLTAAPVIRAFRVRGAADIRRAEASRADAVLLDAGAGEGKTFDWELLREMGRPYFLAGGLNPGNVASAVRVLRPYAVDVSTGIETDGRKDIVKMRAFMQAVERTEST